MAPPPNRDGRRRREQTFVVRCATCGTRRHDTGYEEGGEFHLTARRYEYTDEAEQCRLQGRHQWVGE